MKATIVITIGIITSIIGTIILLTTKDVADYEKEGEIRKMTASKQCQGWPAINLSHKQQYRVFQSREIIFEVHGKFRIDFFLIL